MGEEEEERESKWRRREWKGIREWKMKERRGREGERMGV